MHPRSLVGVYGMRSKGGDFASVSNNHPHIFEVMVTRELFDLTRWTGNDYYRRRAIEHWRFVCQMLCRVDRQFNGFRGGMAEQFYWSNWANIGQDTTLIEEEGFSGHWNAGPHYHPKGMCAALAPSGASTSSCPAQPWRSTAMPR
ncbi:MAG: hypothetical protein HQ523_07170 [Lentisphaerae bacterium]|nr:hypothetical protein [Lentisphaerota bacterium]